MLIVDIRDDLPDFREYLERRLAQELAGSEKSDPVYQINFGFEFGESNWVALVFDRREDAGPDGEWYSMIAQRDFLERPKWPIWHELPEGEEVIFINVAGERVEVMEDPDNRICRVVGDALRDTLLKAREDGVFAGLPKGEECHLAVENFEGYYGWPLYEDRGKEDLLH